MARSRRRRSNYEVDLFLSYGGGREDIWLNEEYCIWSVWELSLWVLVLRLDFC